jgi:predicted ATPase/two-component sensor histidine kinase/PAS domain-containing protein
MEPLTIPDKLYGRTNDIVALITTFERISSGHGEVLLVPGSSGVGKTALVQELRKPIQDRNGFFIKGKFDQYRQNIPYSAFRQALAELCRELQSGNVQQCSKFKADILQAMGSLGQVLVELVPEFESFLGTQPPLGDISPQEARHRFTDVFRNFLKVICWPEHPLILFLDDWQWADAASCELLKQLQVGSALRYLLVIISYRDDEVDSGHPLMSAVDSLRSHAVPVDVLHVNNITAHDVKEIVSDTLKPATENVEGLAAIIHGKTLGNPFFVRSFLSFLHEFNRIWFDKARNRWQWRMDKSGEADLPDNVVDLYVIRLRHLDMDSRSLFSLAACLGNRFDLETLGIISGRDPGECLELLISAHAQTFLLPSGACSRTGEDLRFPRVCMFLHDCVQQAAYSLIEPAELPSLLLKIGRLLLARLQPEQLAEKLYEVVNDLNAGRHLMQDMAERVQAVELNLSAARKAYAATAYRSSLQFYRAADSFLKIPGFAEHLWRENHELVMQLFKERAECEFLEGNHLEAEHCIQQAFAQAGTAVEKAATLTILIVQYTLLARYPEAITAGRMALDALGISLPEEGYEEARDEEIAAVRQELGNRLVSSLNELPMMSHPEMLLASKILITMGPPCYRSHQRLWSVIVPKVVNLTLRYGNIPQVGYSHTAFGGLLGWVDNDYATAKEFGELATRLMTGTFRSPSDQSVFYLMIGSSIRHWFKHLRYGSQDYTDAYEIGLRAGNLQYAAYAFGHNMYCRFYQGAPLAALIRESRYSLEFSRTRLNQWAIDLLEGGLNIFGALSGESPALNGRARWSEQDYLRRVEDNHNIQVTCIYKVLEAFSLLVLGDHEGALRLSDEAEPLIYTVGTQGLLPWPEHVFARLLILTALYAKANVEQQDQWQPELERMMGKLRIWADNCPENFAHKYWLAAAELARIDGRPAEAMGLYDQAVEAAHEGGFLHWQGMANERAAGFWLERGNERLAYAYWQQAYVCYDRWGAAAKVEAMETAYSAYLAENLPAAAAPGQPAQMLETEARNALLEKQVAQLRDYASQMQQTRLWNEAATQAEELALAMQRLRVEIAERKRTESQREAALTALSESEDRFHSLFDNMGEGVALHELVFAGGNPVNYRIIDINNRFMKIIGVSREQVINKLATEAYGTSTPPYFEEYAGVAIGKKPIYFETYFASLDRHFAISVGPWRENGFATIFSDISERIKAEQDIQQNESRLKGLVDILQHQSETIQDFLDYALEQAINLTGSKIGYIYHYHEDRREFILNTWSREVMAECAVANPLSCYELDKTGIWGEAVRQRRPIVVNDFQAFHPFKKGYPEGHVHLLKFMTVPIFRDGRIVGVVGLANKENDYKETDILQVTLLMEAIWKVTDRKRSEEETKRQLAEKEMLLKEVHHRIKNNIASIGGLLSLRLQTITSPEAAAVIQEAIGRVNSMRIIYDKLLLGAGYKDIPAKNYIESLVDAIVALFPDNTKVTVEKRIANFHLDAKRLFPLGLIINELITNMMKYAFIGKDNGLIKIFLTHVDKQVTLTISDDGVGLPEGFDMEESKGFGLMLVKMLGQQLGGSFSIETHNGTRSTLEFDI